MITLQRSTRGRLTGERTVEQNDAKRQGLQSRYAFWQAEDYIDRVDYL